MEHQKAGKDSLTEASHWSACPKCYGQGKKGRRIRKKVRLAYLKALEAFEQSDQLGEPPARPQKHMELCLHCSGSGLLPATHPTEVKTDEYPHIAIVGGGIGGVALAVACLHRGVPFSLYERDSNFEARSQGYGLTLQQASKAIEGFGVFALPEGVVSTRHLVHTPEGKVVGEWGMRKWLHSGNKAAPKRTNIHIARQSLRHALLNELGYDKVQWGHQLVDISTTGSKVELEFNVNGSTKKATADILVGADGIRSTVRRFLIGEEASPLRYLGCIVILGICPLKDIEETCELIDQEKKDLLDSATVFQTANGTERIYIMPYDADSVMWQLSFPMPEEEAKALSGLGVEALKAEACRRTQWHAPIPQILSATSANKVSGYPVYDRALLTEELLQKEERITLIGDAAHPMSPFKGQGANQALLDALSLARTITKNCLPFSPWQESGVRESVLNEFEAEMLARSAVKVKDSAEAAEFLHSDLVLFEGNEPRGRCRNRESD
ncbi:FAD-dependent monooxygenase [Marinomonas sp. C2222]|uniref:FAD-dependent monooxygenase n=1 Tax=Marinomonas sargassi TaxID=2984494 RepID=A0ABT2YTM4_9GAMM|nr:NAD(P)/FAD-dependent oxidoreductase [Marinomonas sargassi]MCV2403245.1 FAD-dependent monooxygenase [Marinomonas sargassi]